MIRRRIESGDIPVHWVEIDGKLEMRVAAEDMGGLSSAPAFSDPFAPPGSEDDLQPAAGEPAAEEWAVTETDYSQGLWTPVEDAGTSQGNPWEVNPSSDLAAAELGPSGVPVWRPDPATWEDEPLDTPNLTPSDTGFGAPFPASNSEAVEIDQATAGSEETAPAGSAASEEEAEFAGSFFTAEPAPTAFTTPPAPGFGFEPPPPEPLYATELEPEAEPYALEATAEPPPLTFDAGVPADLEPDWEPGLQAVEFEAVEEVEPAPAPVEEEAARPSALVASQMAGAGSVAINSIDARELVAGLFERWERALEQRIQAEQRLRFEAELEQRLRQVRDLRQELDQTRKTQAAQMAEREREMMELRNKLRELEQAPKKGGFFRR